MAAGTLHATRISSVELRSRKRASRRNDPLAPAENRKRPSAGLARLWSRASKRRDGDAVRLQHLAQSARHRDGAWRIAVDADGLDLPRNALAAYGRDRLLVDHAQHARSGLAGVVQHRAGRLAAREIAGVIVGAVGIDLAHGGQP